ncbi:hypothetical protein [Streptomyces arenae]|uniref:hypothetical protein n=1 Tax=Streptomyces arenae TaxID=29301 RepID=UPI0026589EE5|nr:hypothetical protein [Streptomyces arenae]MCG7210465.1 hypothetical protein [Streptomyces arenae]
MEPIALSAATALVGAMTSEAWQHVRDAVARWWRRARPQQADSVVAALEESRDRALTAGPDEDTDDLVATWRARLEALLWENPALEDELRELVDRDIAPHVRQEADSRTGNQEFRADARGHARIYQTGGNLNINES